MGEGSGSQAVFPCEVGGRVKEKRRKGKTTRAKHVGKREQEEAWEGAPWVLVCNNLVVCLTLVSLENNLEEQRKEK